MCSGKTDHSNKKFENQQEQEKNVKAAKKSPRQKTRKKKKGIQKESPSQHEDLCWVCWKHREPSLP